MSLLDQNGQPIAKAQLSGTQTAQVGSRVARSLAPQATMLTPDQIRSWLYQADHGSLLYQSRLFAEMEDVDAHLASEFRKRKLALLTLDWDIVPPRNATAREEEDAAWLKEVLTDAVDPIEDAILAMMEGVGHGFSAVELEWIPNDSGERLPRFHPRPQEWFRIAKEDQSSFRLIDGSAEGAPLWPFGWAVHIPGKPKTGYLGRAGMFRPLVWPYLYKHYGIGDFAEFLESYGLPLILGKYPSSASESEKDSLLAAVVSLGHDARAIMPAEMAIEIAKVTSAGESNNHMAMIAWAERAQSKLIVGQTMSSEAQASGLGSGNAELHREVRHDILEADARQIGATITRDLCFPIIAINRGLASLARCPRFVFDTSQAEDIGLLSKAIPQLVGAGVRIPERWVHEKLRIPVAQQGEPVLAIARPDLVEPPFERQSPPPEGAQAKAARAILATAVPGPADAADDPGDPTPASALAERMRIEADPAWQQVVDHLGAMVQAASSLEELRASILAAYSGLPLADLRQVLAQGLAVAALAGVADVQEAKTT